MPRFKPTAKLERSALADLWKHTLSRIATVSGRLVYLSGLRDSNSGTYKHHGLITAFGRDEAVRALRQSHQETFQLWLNLPLAQKNEDLKSYFVGLDYSQDEVVEHWLKSHIYRNHMPASALKMESELYCGDMELLLELLSNDAITRRQRSVDDGPHQDSVQPA